METVMQNATVSPVVIPSPVEAATLQAIRAIQEQDSTGLRNALVSLKEAIGQKPARADFADRDSFKAAMDTWDKAKRNLSRVFASAEAAGLTVRETYSASGSASGSVTLAHRRAVRIAPSFAKFRI